MACSQSNDGENSQFSGDIPVRVDEKHYAEPGQGDSQFEETSTNASNKVLRETEADGKNMDLTSKLNTQSNSETTGGDMEMSDSKCVTKVVRSKYFKGSDEAKLQLQQSSLSQIKIATFDSKRIETVQLSCADKGAIMDDKAIPDEESLPNIRSESFKGLDDTKSQPKQESLTQAKVGAIGSQGITTSQPCTADKSHRGGCNSDNAGRTLSGTSMLHDKNAARGEVISDGSRNNMKYLNTLSRSVC